MININSYMYGEMIYVFLKSFARGISKKFNLKVDKGLPRDIFRTHVACAQKRVLKFVNFKDEFI